MERSTKLRIFEVLLVIAISCEVIFAASRMQPAQASYHLEYAYSIVVDQLSYNPAPGNVTVLLNLTNAGNSEGDPVIQLTVFTYGGHFEAFRIYLGSLAIGARLNTTWRQSFAALDSQNARLSLYVMEG